MNKNEVKNCRDKVFWMHLLRAMEEIFPKQLKQPFEKRHEFIAPYTHEHTAMMCIRMYAAAKKFP